MFRTTVLQECGSTNTEAHDRDKYRHGDAIIALRQTAGRGQRGRSWESEPGENLTFSVVLEPVFLKVTEQFMLSEALALAVADTLRHYKLEPSVKWTNDIYVGNGKICGMLLEHDIKSDHLSRTIAGIGINVNQTAFSPNVPNPSSISLLTGRRYDIMEVFDTFSTKFSERYKTLESGDFRLVSEAYNESLYRRDIPARYFIPGEGEVPGIIRRVEQDGRLIVEIEGRERSFLFKEIEFII